MATPFLIDPESGQNIQWSLPRDRSTLEITIAAADHIRAKDAGSPPVYTLPWKTEFSPILRAAEHVWEAVANVRFRPIGDNDNSFSALPNIRVGLADISKGLNPPTQVGFTAYTFHNFDNVPALAGPTADFDSGGVRVSILDPRVLPVAAMSNGDYHYQGYETTVFQTLIQQLGHALGLATNPNDPNSVMYGTLTSRNVLPDSQDITAIQTLYGKPTSNVVFDSQVDRDTTFALVNA